MKQQPWLHDLQIAVDGPSTALGDHRGDFGAEPGTGWFVDDRRVLSTWSWTLDGEQPTPVARHTSGAQTRVWMVARHLGTNHPDPTVEVHRTRTLAGPVLTETLRVESRDAEPVVTRVVLSMAGDDAMIASVKSGEGTELSTLLPAPERSMHRHDVDVDAAPQPDGQQDGTWAWDLRIEPHGHAEIVVTVRASRTSPSEFDAEAASGDADFQVAVHGDVTWAKAVESNLRDLRHLLLTDPVAPADHFVAAGTPWYLTLFGRDSLWSARMMLPYSGRLAAGTLRTLARRQAVAHDPALAAEPGKMLHEARRETFTGGSLSLPPLYYGSVDSTPLWICLLHDAWRWGMPLEEVRDLLPTLQAALGWMSSMVEASQDGFLRYVDEAGAGLANQGWKDSGDSMRRGDGSIAPAPIALVEAQGYAVEAAHGAAALLDALGEPGGEQWRTWGDDLAERIREHFWVGSGPDAYLAMALDADGRQVDGVGSNMGHLLGTAALTDEENRQVARRLMQPDMLRHFGIGTLSAENPAWNPTGYHSGSVWTHDTAIVLGGLRRAGLREEADAVLEALLRLSVASDHRLPELVGGDPLGDAVVPYPASCRPQGWSAASAAAMVTAALGLQVDVPAGTWSVDPSALLPAGWVVEGVRLRGEAVTLRASDLG